uniref:Serine-threonine kinase receptor-associated protein n=1 Tax=Oryza punctata TaxID=4537 RepID=A0A0E0MH22_ORYPU
MASSRPPPPLPPPQLSTAAISTPPSPVTPDAAPRCEPVTLARSPGQRHRCAPLRGGGPTAHEAMIGLAWLGRVRHRRRSRRHHYRQLHGEENVHTAQVKRIAEDPDDCKTRLVFLSLWSPSAWKLLVVWILKCGCGCRIGGVGKLPGPLNRTIITAVRMPCHHPHLGHGATLTGTCPKESDKEQGHQKTITSLSKSADWSHFLTGSLDKFAKLWDTRTLTLIKTYVTERPVNAVDISPLLDHVVIGGGKDAMNVTMTDLRAGKFEGKFFHKILKEEIGDVKGHFGPINALAFNPDGRCFSSGGEDGYVRLHHFDSDYFNISNLEVLQYFVSFTT